MSADANKGPMSGGAKGGDEAAPQLATDAGSAKRPYRTPVLRRLGSVRELTLGGTRGMTEGAGSFMTM